MAHKKLLSNWGNYPAVTAEETSFRTVKEAREFIAKHDGIISRGMGRCYGDASLAQHSISTLQFNKILFFDRLNGIIECEAGVTLDSILEVVVPAGWFLPVTPGTKYVSIGGAVASNVHGKNHHIDGCFGDHVIDMEVIVASGESLFCSKEVKADLFVATMGGMGLTGLITRVKFKLKKIYTSYIRQRQVKARNLIEVFELFEQYRHHTYSVAWIDCLKGGDASGRSILILGEHALSEELNARQSRNPLTTHSNKHLPIPFNLPSFILNKYSVKLFNYLYYNKKMPKISDDIVPYDSFFYPLDVIRHWNRGHGRRGVIQYQLVFPLENSLNGLTEVLKRIRKSGMGSFLTVLKLFGPYESLISFPMEGYTLALDFPVERKLFPFLEELDRIVLGNGGRLYLTKDARMSPDMFTKGYPDADKFLDIVNKYNPVFKFSSLLSTRLNITTKQNAIL